MSANYSTTDTTIESVRPFSVMFGYSGGTDVNVVGASLAAGNITIDLIPADVVTQTITIAEFGTDSGDGAKPRAGYVGNTTITGLTAFTQYTYTATQNGNTETGSFYTAPTASDNFCVYLNTCDRVTPRVGHYSKMRQDIEQGLLAAPVVANFHIDDHMGYVDSPNGASGAEAAYASTGDPAVTLTAFDYGVSYMAGLGLLATTHSHGRYANRLWCLRNINYIPQWGDHEFDDDFLGNAATPNPMHATPGGFDGAALAAYNAFLAPLQPPSSTIPGRLDTTSNHWACEYGDLCIIAGDAITQADGTTTMYGTNQIRDILAKYNSTTATHKIFLSSIRMSHPGSTYSLRRDVSTEYDALIRAKTGSPNAVVESSIMQNDATNGANGVFTSFSGDLHSIYALKHGQVADANNLAEDYIDHELGTVNVSGTLRLVPGPVGTILTANGESAEVVYDSGISNLTPGCGGATVEIDTTVPMMRTTLRFSHLDGEAGSPADSSYSRIFVAGVGGNSGLPTDTAYVNTHQMGAMNLDISHNL